MWGVPQKRLFVWETPPGVLGEKCPPPCENHKDVSPAERAPKDYSKGVPLEENLPKGKIKQNVW